MEVDEGRLVLSWGRMVANSAIELGMSVIGYDPYLSLRVLGSFQVRFKKQQV